MSSSNRNGAVQPSLNLIKPVCGRVFLDFPRINQSLTLTKKEGGEIKIEFFGICFGFINKDWSEVTIEHEGKNMALINRSIKIFIESILEYLKSCFSDTNEGEQLEEKEKIA